MFNQQPRFVPPEHQTNESAPAFASGPLVEKHMRIDPIASISAPSHDHDFEIVDMNEFQQPCHNKETANNNQGHFDEDEMMADAGFDRPSTQQMQPCHDGESPKRKPSVRAKRMKRNQKLRKMLTPKNALMIMYELKGSEMSEFTVRPYSGGFQASVRMGDQTFSAEGVSKIQAKTLACEQAFQQHILSVMARVPKKPATPAVAVPPTDGDDEPLDEDVPMMHLASFALHKLFNEWHASGVTVPDFQGTPAAAGSGSAVKPTSGGRPNAPATVRTELPDNHRELHPSMLLAIMRPQTQYYTIAVSGQPPNVVHSVGIQVNGLEFVGSARSKKAARKTAAAEACNTCFAGCAYQHDEGATAQQRPAPANGPQ